MRRRARLRPLVLMAAAAAVLGCTVDEAAVPVTITDGGGPGIDAPLCPSAMEIRSAAGAACLCDDQCAGGACILGTCCEGEVCKKRPQGATCSAGEMCASGFCADGVCCDVACDGGCLACNLAGKVGACSVVPEGAADPHGRCHRDPPESCGQTGQCNGQGGCARQAAGTLCRPGSCSDGHTLSTGGACDGEGQCQPGLTIDCAPWTCGDAGCRAACSDDSQCVAPARCRDGRCGKLALGSACTRGDDCVSQNCADGVCCDSACGDRCAYCAFSGNLGHCVSVGAGAPDPRAAAGNQDPERVCRDQGEASCGTNGRCDGSRGCQRYPEGTACRPAACDPATGTSTAAGLCHQGACAVPAAQSCAPFAGCQGGRCATFCAHDTDCLAGTVCQGGSCGKRPAGAPCSGGGECATGICAQGRCCMTACDGVCRSCALDGSPGVCTPVPAGGADPAGRCPDDACRHGCDGAGACRRQPGGTSCRPASCTADGALVTYGCADDGSCQARTTPCGAGTVCSAMTGTCQVVARGPGQPCGGSNGPCQGGLGCVGGICCAAGSCTGPCLTGACKGDGSGCAPRPRGTDCGTACTSGSELATRTCNDAGVCATSTTACPLGQTCKGAACQPIGGGCGSQCDRECTVVNLFGLCIPSADGTPCHGRSGMTCQKCVCTK